MQSPEGSKESYPACFPNLRFEPGFHPHNGNNGSIWTSELTDRLAAYCPHILSIDSFCPQLSNNPLSGNERILPFLPQKAEKLTPFWLIAGDVFGWSDYSISLLYRQPGNQTEANTEIQKKANEITFDSGKSKIAADYLLPIIPGLVAGVCYYLCHRQPEITRRDFLQKSLKCLFLLLASKGYQTVGRAAAVTGASFAKDEETKNFFMQLGGKVKPDPDNWLLIGRTALAIAKIQDTYPKQGLGNTAPGAIINGNHHQFEAQNLMESSLARNKAIFTMAKKICDVMDAIADEFRFDTHLHNEVREIILDYLELTEVFWVASPTRDQIALYGRFQSPQVAKAVETLREGYSSYPKRSFNSQSARL